MDKLETVIFNSLDKFKNIQISLYAKVSRQYLAQEIAKDIKNLADKERQEKECNQVMPVSTWVSLRYPSQSGLQLIAL